MKNIIKYLLVLVLGAGIASASEYRFLYKEGDPISAKKFGVFVELEDQKLRSTFENSIMQAIARHNHVSGFSGQQMFPPSRQWEDSKIYDRLGKMEIESLLKIRFIKADPAAKIDKAYIEASVTRVKEKTKIVVVGNDTDFENLSPEERTTFIKEYSSILIGILFKEGYVYDCNCGGGGNYDNLTNPGGKK